MNLTDSAANAGRPARVSDLFHAGHEPPTGACLTFEGRSWSRAQLESAIEGTVSVLSGMDLHSGQLVAVIGENSPQLVAALLAVWDHDLAVAPINPRLSEHERDSILEVLRPAAVIAPSDISKSVMQRFATTGVVALGEPPRLLQAPSAVDDRSVESDCALVLHTSGTTGTPKAAMLSHSGMLQALTSVVRFLTSRNQARTASQTPSLVAFPLSHVAGLFNLLLSFRNGSEVILMRRFRVPEFVRIVEERGLRSVVLNPTMIHMLTESADVAREQLASLRYVRTGSAPLSASVAHRFLEKFGIPVLNAYGQTETSGEVIGWTAHDAREYAKAKLGSVGRPHPGVDLRFVDDSLTDVRAGEVGELCVRTPTAMKTYLDGRQVDAIDGFVRTGDLGYLDNDGFVWLVGRKSDVIVCGGFKVLPEEVEEVLRQHDEVADVMVGAVPDERLGEVPHAFVVPRNATGSLGERDLVEFVRKRLAHYKAPRAVHFVDDLPRNATGKLVRSRATEFVD